MRAPIETTEDVGIDPMLFANKVDEVTIVGVSERMVNGDSQRVYESTPREANLPIGNNEPEVLHSMRATVFEVGDLTIRLKLGNDVFVNIPKAVFGEKGEALKYGQAVIYSIKKRATGFRFQDLDIDHQHVQNPYKQQVADILKTIPKR